MWGLLIGAGLVGLFAGFWLLIGGFAALVPKEPGDVTLGIGIAVVGGGVPGAIAAILVAVALRSRRRLRNLETLAVMARSGTTVSTDDVCRTLAMSPAAAERLLFEAFSLGVLVDRSPPQVAGQAPPVPWEQQPPSADPASAPAPAPAADSVSRAGTQPSEYPGRLSSESLVGITLNDAYRIESLLGSGGMGEVYVASHVRTGRRYAIKALLPGSRFSEEAIKRFKREAAAASALGHPGIVAVHDFDVTPDGTHYLVCELLEGETLEDRLARDGAMPWPEAARIALQVASALETAHGAGILHRDLKPGNMFLCNGPAELERLVLLDFGLAKPIDDAASTKITATGAVVGTPLYMSPEQACCETLDARSDVYGFGAVLFEMVTGAPPFVESTVAGLYAKLLNDDPPRATEVADQQLPTAVDELLATALAKDPGDRFASASALANAISAIESSEVASSGVRVGTTG